MKTTKIYNMMAAVLIAAMSIGFTSCKDNKEPEQEVYLSGAILMARPWHQQGTNSGAVVFELNRDGTYSYVTKDETINGIYRITEAKKGTFDITWYNSILESELTFTEEAFLYKILVSGSNDFDTLWIYFPHKRIAAQLFVHLYSGNERIKIVEMHFG